jgi:hypothetical protein
MEFGERILMGSWGREEAEGMKVKRDVMGGGVGGETIEVRVVDLSPRLLEVMLKSD